MDSIHERKYNFCNHELLWLLQEIDKDIIYIKYEVEGNDEFVRVDWLCHGSGQSYHKKICVTGNNLRTLAINVIRRI